MAQVRIENFSGCMGNCLANSGVYGTRHMKVGTPQLKSIHVCLKSMLNVFIDV